MNNNTKIQLTNSFRDIIVKMVDGNPGALNTIMDLQKNELMFDPDSIWGGLGPLILLDS